MEEILLRFSNIGESIINALDMNSLQKCKIVGRTWKNFIESPNQKKLSIKFIKNHEKAIFMKDYISLPQKWSKLRRQDLWIFERKLTLARRNYRYEKREELFLEKYAELGTELNGTDQNGLNALQMFCSTTFEDGIFSNILITPKQKTKIAKMLLRRSAEFNIDVNVSPVLSYLNPFHMACFDDNVELVEFMIDNANSINLNLKAETSWGMTGFEIAVVGGNKKVANMIKEKLPVGNY